MTDYLLLGFGDQRKLIYRNHTLLDAFTGESLREWSPSAQAVILPGDYKVRLPLPGGTAEEVSETASGMTLPRFDDYGPVAPLLRTLHGEILFNIKEGVPYPNIFVYDKPWYRDAAMVGMVLKETGNLALIRDWIMNLREPYDRCNAGNEEPDNLGQLLYLISLVSDKNHPLVNTILAEIPRFCKDNYIVGLSDFAEHPVYQTKWLKFGLRCLKLPDPYQIPPVYDSYSALFWWDYKQQHVPGLRFSAADRQNYPYLAWAEDHFFGDPLLEFDSQAYPLTWEAEASQANYAGMARLSEADARNKICRPHTWHAAEMFLYLHKISLH